MKPEQAVPRNKSARKFLFTGFSFGVLASFLVLVFISFKWGPQGENIEVDLYSGHILIHKHFLWKRTHTRGPMSDHVTWAIQHQNPKRNWYVFASSISRAEWFGPMTAVDSTARPYVYEIYSLPLPEAEKIQILHQYHQDLDTVQQKLQEHTKITDYMESFYTKWQQQMEKLRNNQAAE